MGLKVLTQKEIRACITMKQAILAMEEAFKDYYLGTAVLPLRTPIAVANENALTLTMPAYLGKQDALGLKVVSIFPNNSKQHKPSINGLILLLDEHSGEGKALMEASYLTAMRTGAVSGLATQYLAKGDASHVAILGSGVQAYTQLEAVLNVRSIKKISLWSRSLENAKKMANELDQKHYEINCFSTVREALKDADIICAATGSTEPLIHLEDLKEGAHINAVGSHTPQMREINNQVLAHSLVVVDQIEAACAEAGEIVSALEEKSIQVSQLVELGALISGNKSHHNNHYTVFKSVGLAIQDISIANTVYLNACKKDLGTSIELY
ncbi:ornithine cyclodeaminase family protein [Legionella sp. km772]|uniref:ornithine cyclodeaminase family protein n=1 Tax=Legionella sp. km772 TaxID=2498111 RepID=UPI000F8EC5EE|nr:ornithine cyclodeaminase family protein [Legionella sp. km772]RUR05936.1 ornithine cyclodeaminase family protein [Legionella sp. km772]